MARARRLCGVWVGDGVADTVALADGVVEGLAEGLAVSVWDADGLAEGLLVREPDAVGVGVREPVMVALGEGLAVASSPSPPFGPLTHQEAAPLPVLPRRDQGWARCRWRTERKWGSWMGCQTGSSRTARSPRLG